MTTISAATALRLMCRPPLFSQRSALEFGAEALELLEWVQERRAKVAVSHSPAAQGGFGCRVEWGARLATGETVIDALRNARAIDSDTSALESDHV